MRARPGFVLAWLAVAVVSGCSGRKTPRQQIQEAIAAAEEAAEEKDLPALAEKLSKSYTGGGDLDRAAILGLLRLQFLRAQAIHLLVRVPAIHVQSEDRAEATVLVGMAATPIAAAQQLASLSADLYKFELDFAREEGAWRVVSARWSPAMPADFL
jgi:hypothetical protein